MAIVTKKPIKMQRDKIESLIKVYSQAIEFYQSQESELFVDMTLRMQKLLVKPEILKILDDSSEIDEVDEPMLLKRESSETNLISPTLRKF
jgi:hypothetical protein